MVYCPVIACISTISGIFFKDFTVSLYKKLFYQRIALSIIPFLGLNYTSTAQNKELISLAINHQTDSIFHLRGQIIDENNKTVGSINPTKIINTVFGGRKNGK